MDRIRWKMDVILLSNKIAPTIIRLAMCEQFTKYSNFSAFSSLNQLSRPDLTTKKRRGGKRIRRLKEVS